MYRVRFYNRWWNSMTLIYNWQWKKYIWLYIMVPLQHPLAYLLSIILLVTRIMYCFMVNGSMYKFAGLVIINVREWVIVRVDSFRFYYNWYNVLYDLNNVLINTKCSRMSNNTNLFVQLKFVVSGVTCCTFW